jgi:hypothetical protein
MQSTFDFSSFSLISDKSPSRKQKPAHTNFRTDPAPGVHFILQAGGGVVKNVSRKQLGIKLNTKAMEFARFVCGDKVNVMINPDHSVMVIERNPAGHWTLSGYGTSTANRAAAVGRSTMASVKFNAPEWMLTHDKLVTGMLAQGADIEMIDGKLVIKVNL